MTVTLSIGSFALRISASIASSRLPSIPCDAGEAVRQPAVGQYDGTGGSVASTLGCAGGACIPTGPSAARAPPAEATLRDPLDTPPTSTIPVTPRVIRPTTHNKRRNTAPPFRQKADPHPPVGHQGRR